MPMRHLNRDLRKLYESGSGVQQKGLGQRSKFGENWYSNSQGKIRCSVKSKITIVISNHNNSINEDS